MTNVLAAGQRVGVGHQVILSIVGVDRVPRLDYYRAKTLQEDLLRQGPTQFFEFTNAVLSWTSDETTVRLPSTRLQPIAAADVVDAVVEVATGTPLCGIRNVAGPDVSPLDETRQDHSGSTAGQPDRHHRRQGRHVRGRHWRRAYRGPGRTPGTHALPGLNPDGPVTGWPAKCHGS